MEDVRVCDLAFFLCEVVGVKFHQLGGRTRARSSTKVVFVREPDNQHDSNAVLCCALLEGSRVVLGHVSAKAARWLSFLLSLLLGKYLT